MTESSRDGIEIVLLAAGGSSRLGHPKQLLKFRDQSLLRRAAEQALNTGLSVHVVLGAARDRLRAELESLPVDIVVNPEWRQGISASIRAGSQRIAENASGVLIMLCDQPLVTAAHLNELIDVSGSRRGCIAASEYGGVLGVPAVFGRDYFDELMNLEGDEGARALIAAHSAEVMGVNFADAGLDIDCEKDVETLKRIS